MNAWHCPGAFLSSGEALAQSATSPSLFLTFFSLDDCPLAPYTQPALTTVRQPMRRIGERAVEVLVDKIEASAATTTATEPLQGTYFKPTLVIRESA